MLLLDGLEVDAVDIEGVEVLDKYGWLKDDNVLFKDMDSGITGSHRMSEFWNILATSIAKLYSY